jgi:hypothetical protein
MPTQRLGSSWTVVLSTTPTKKPTQRNRHIRTVNKYVACLLQLFKIVNSPSRPVYLNYVSEQASKTGFFVLVVEEIHCFVLSDASGRLKVSVKVHSYEAFQEKEMKSVAHIDQMIETLKHIFW